MVAKNCEVLLVLLVLILQTHVVENMTYDIVVGGRLYCGQHRYSTAIVTLIEESASEPEFDEVIGTMEPVDGEFEFTDSPVTWSLSLLLKVVHKCTVYKGKPCRESVYKLTKLPTSDGDLDEFVILNLALLDNGQEEDRAVDCDL